MDLAAIRADLAAVLQGLGWQATDHVPDTTATLPAAVVNVPDNLKYGFTAGGNVRFDLPLELYAALAQPETAQRQLDKILSTKAEGSLPDALQNANETRLITTTDPVRDVSWNSMSITSAGNPRQVVIGNNLHALAITVTLDVLG